MFEIVKQGTTYQLNFVNILLTMKKILFSGSAKTFLKEFDSSIWVFEVLSKWRQLSTDCSKTQGMKQY